MPLTDTAVRNAKPKGKPYKLGDSGGLFLLVQPSGGKLWRLKYRLEGREKKLGIGVYPAPCKPDAGWSARRFPSQTPQFGYLA